MQGAVDCLMRRVVKRNECCATRCINRSIRRDPLFEMTPRFQALCQALYLFRRFELRSLYDTVTVTDPCRENPSEVSLKSTTSFMVLLVL